MHDESIAIPEQRLRTAISDAISSALPSETEFRAGVLGELARRSKGESSLQARREGQQDLPALRWFRAAASLLPAGFSQAAFAGSQSAKGAVAKSIAGKTLGAALLPLFAFALTLASFTTAVNRTAGLNGDRRKLRPGELGGIELRAWIKANWWSALLMGGLYTLCLLYTSPSPRDQRGSRMPSSA